MPPAPRRPEKVATRRSPDSRRGGPDSGRPRSRQRSAHSMESLLAGAIALLDEAGEPALTFRALAARIGGGVGSIYWYVASKEELLDRATDAVLGEVLTGTESIARGKNPIQNLRALALALYGAMEAHPWLAAYLLRDVGLQPNSMRLYERFGQQLLRLDLTRRQRFHAVSALVSYVVGVGADMAQSPHRAAALAISEDERRDYLADAVAQWRGFDPAEYPFVHEVAEEFEKHEDKEQFTAGLDLLLAGLSAQVRGRS